MTIEVEVNDVFPSNGKLEWRSSTLKSANPPEGLPDRWYIKNGKKELTWSRGFLGEVDKLEDVEVAIKPLYPEGTNFNIQYYPGFTRDEICRILI